MRNADGRSSGRYTMRRLDQRHRDLTLEGRSQGAASERNARGETRTIRAVGCRSLAGLRMMVLGVDVAEVIGSAVLDDLAVGADMDMRVSENRRQYAERQSKPDEIEIPANYHEATGCLGAKQASSMTNCGNSCYFFGLHASRCAS